MDINMAAVHPALQSAIFLAHASAEPEQLLSLHAQAEGPLTGPKGHSC